MWIPSDIWILAVVTADLDHLENAPAVHIRQRIRLSMQTVTKYVGKTKSSN